MPQAPAGSYSAHDARGVAPRAQPRPRGQRASRKDGRYVERVYAAAFEPALFPGLTIDLGRVFA
jgi:hypothetical protein